MYRPWSLTFQDMMIWYVMCLSSVIGSAASRSMTTMVSCNSVTTVYLNARARSKINRYRRDYAVKNINFAPAILSVTDKIHPEFLCLLWVLADM